MLILKQLIARFLGHSKTEPKTKESCVREAKEIRAHMTERQIDKTLADSFPASDPPAWY